MLKPQVLASAGEIGAKLSGLLASQDGRVHFRPTDSGITMVGLLPGRPQRGKGGYAAEGILEGFEEKFRKHCVDIPQGRPTPEKQLQSFLIGNAYRHGRRFEALIAGGDGSGRFEDVIFITDEIPMEAGGRKIVCDLLALRRTRGRSIPVLIELKSRRAMTELVGQLTAYSAAMDKHAEEFVQLYSALLGEKVHFDAPTEKWLVWPGPDDRPGPDPRQDELTAKGIGVIQYVSADSGFSFRVGPQPVATVIITHGDVDGMVCAAQLIRRAKAKPEVLFSNGRWIASKLRAISRRERLPDEVYVTDIAAGAETVSAAGNLAERGVAIYWIDHHPWSGDGVLDQMVAVCERVIHNASLQTPAGVLLGQWLGAEDPYCDRIGRICYAGETGTPWERDWFRLLSTYVGECEQSILDRLAYDHDLTEDDLARIAAERAREDVAADILGRPPQVVATEGEATIAVYDTTDTPGVYLGHKVFRHHQVDYCLIRIGPGKWQVASRPGSGQTLQALTGTHDLHGLRIRVAGRPDRLLAIETESRGAAGIHEHVVDWVRGLL